MANDLSNTVVLITGASSGIGRSCAHKFAEAGSSLVLAARRGEKLKELAKDLTARHDSKVHTLELDVRNREAVSQSLGTLGREWNQIDVLVNNAGLSRGLDKLQDGSLDDWEEMIDTNIKGLLYVSKAVIPGMVARGKGTIVNIGSIAGHEVYPRGNVYCATKHAVDALTKGMRLDLYDTPVRVCTVDPGLVETEFSMVRFRGDKGKAEKVYTNFTPLSPDDIADAVVYCASRPAHVQIAEMIVLPSAQGSSTLVDRRG